MHIFNEDETTWIRSKIEGSVYQKVSKEEKQHNYDRIARASMFGDFLSEKFNTMKRFGLEGCESFIPGIKSCID